ncbi:hypothetical protein BpHYR1_037459 [Brachionus plicatilis]|uniref:Uncharacterized protein n=1 Tax=Brachionus plicatilis TaxID=10195 RepID=A0A3M7S6W1_BRAPC|nr:hypothetical protein BpHYR1_037459 [Brachionus plicatilis]
MSATDTRSNNSLNLEICGNELENEKEINGYNYVLLFYTFFKPSFLEKTNPNLKITSALLVVMMLYHCVSVIGSFHREFNYRSF